MRPAAPWRIAELDLARPLRALERGSDARPILLVFRYEGAVLGFRHLLPENLPLSPLELAAVAAQATSYAIAELVRLGPDDAPGATPETSPWAHLPQCDPEELLERLSAVLAERRSRPIKTSASIVICTRHRATQLADCLESIRPELEGGRDVVVVDNGPDQATESTARAFPGVRYIAEPQPGLSRARNTGIEAATGEVAIFLDDDVRPEPGWVEPLLRRFDNEDVAVVCGLVLPERLDTDAQIGFQYDLGFGGMGMLPLVFDAAYVKAWRRGVPAWEIGAGANMAVRCRTVRMLGGFDERIGPGAAGGCGDDSEFWHRVLLSGRRAIYEPLSVVRHQHRRDWSALETQAYSYGLGHVAGLFAQYSWDRDRGDLHRALVGMPRHLFGRLLRAPRRWLKSDPDRLLLPCIKGYLSGLRHFPLALRRRRADEAASYSVSAE